MKPLHAAKPEVALHPPTKGSVRFFHPWIYKSQIKRLPKDILPGGEVIVMSAKGSVIGTGYYNPASEIAIRLLSRQKETVDTAFFRRRLQAAKEVRNKLEISSNATRWVNSESDQLPGLIVDQYAGTAVVQFLTLGMETRRDKILDAIQDVLKPTAIYERSDGTYRGMEGVATRKGWVRGSGPTRIEIKESDTRYWVDIENGHKTGFYLDQRESRGFDRGVWKGAEVLDCFSYTGGFAVAAAKRGAKHVTALDLSESSLALAAENAALNGATNCEFLKSNAFDFLRECEEGGKSFDAIILDPPSFTRSKGLVEKAMKGYKEIHVRAMKILRPGGTLLTFCCSYHVSMDSFQKMVLESARDTRTNAKVLEWFYQAKDHPVLLAVPETLYLKGMALQKV